MQPRVLARDTFEFENSKNIYEVEMLSLNDLIDKKKVIYDSNFKKFVEQEKNKRYKKEYDLNVNIRDLYPLDIHTNNKNENDIKIFYILNDFILNYNKRINRRVTKKEIVYKKDKSKSIVSIKLTKMKGVQLFVSKEIESIDNEKCFFTIPKTNKKPLQKCIKIKGNEELSKILKLMTEYLEIMLFQTL